MATPQTKEKLVLSIVAAVMAATALTLTVAGSFVPRWARPLNSSRTEANTTFSLWYREDCYSIICTTEYRQVHNEVKRSWKNKDGKDVVEVEKFVEEVPITTCVVANYCNTTWFGGNVEFSEVPSLLFVARAFLIPSFIAGFICILIYIVKILMIAFRPTWRRLHVKAAYLTFAAVAGVSCGVGVIIYVVMLEEESYELLWAPALPGVGAALYLLIAIGGYLSWRSHSTDDDFDGVSEISGSDRTSGLYEFSPSGKGRAAAAEGLVAGIEARPQTQIQSYTNQNSLTRQPHHNHHHHGLQQHPDRKLSRAHVHGRSYNRSASEPFGKADPV